MVGVLDGTQTRYVTAKAYNFKGYNSHSVVRWLVEPWGKLQTDVDGRQVGGIDLQSWPHSVHRQDVVFFHGFGLIPQGLWL